MFLLEGKGSLTVFPLKKLGFGFGVVEHYLFIEAFVVDLVLIGSCKLREGDVHDMIVVLTEELDGELGLIAV